MKKSTIILSILLGTLLPNFAFAGEAGQGLAELGLFILFLINSILFFFIGKSFGQDKNYFFGMFIIILYEILFLIGVFIFGIALWRIAYFNLSILFGVFSFTFFYILRKKKEKINMNFIKSLEKINIKKIDFIKLNTYKISGNFFRKFLKKNIKQPNEIIITNENLMKIIYLITEKLGRTEIKAGELNGTYKSILGKYKSDLPEKEHLEKKEFIERFVEQGGKIEIFYK